MSVQSFPGEPWCDRVLEYHCYRRCCTRRRAGNSLLANERMRRGKKVTLRSLTWINSERDARVEMRNLFSESLTLKV